MRDNEQMSLVPSLLPLRCRLCIIRSHAQTSHHVFALHIECYSNNWKHGWRACGLYPRYAAYRSGFLSLQDWLNDSIRKQNDNFRNIRPTGQAVQHFFQQTLETFLSVAIAGEQVCVLPCAFVTLLFILNQMTSIQPPRAISHSHTYTHNPYGFHQRIGNILSYLKFIRYKKSTVNVIGHFGIPERPSYIAASHRRVCFWRSLCRNGTLWEPALA